MFSLRFDMRAPGFGAPAADLYAAAIEMTSFAESRGGAFVVVSEHHRSPDGYLPAPTILATALAARTTQIPIMVAVALLPLYDPVRLAEEMCVLDIVSAGRVSYVGAIGYRREEYEMYGVDFHRRGAIADEKLDVLLRAKTGEPFEHDGRSIHVTPAPVTPGGPGVSWGGGSVAAARRAARFGLDFMGQGGDTAITEAYEAEARAQGRTPGLCFIPPADMAQVVFVADDLDRAWDELGPHLMHDARSYAAWNPGDTTTSSLSFATTADELRAEQRSHRIVTVAEAVTMARTGMPLALHPLIGGLPPEIAWRYLRTVTDEVMPALSA